jgi:hypothetical protein
VKTKRSLLMSENQNGTGRLERSTTFVEVISKETKHVIITRLVKGLVGTSFSCISYPIYRCKETWWNPDIGITGDLIKILGTNIRTYNTTPDRTNRSSCLSCLCVLGLARLYNQNLFPSENQNVELKLTNSFPKNQPVLLLVR